MKNKAALLLIILLSNLFSFSQSGAKFGYVDSEYILSQIPEYKAAQSELDKTSLMWQKEIDGKYSEVDKLYKAYQADAILLTEEMKKNEKTKLLIVKKK